MIDASPHNPGGAYLAANHYQLDDRKPYIYKTSDYGKTWTKIVTGIGESDFVRVVREDPVRAGLLYAGTEHGIYISFDDGAHWQSLSLNLPDTQVADLVVKDRDLIIATHGRSFYIMDNIDPLRQCTDETQNAKVYLYKPGTAVQNVRDAVFYYQLAKPADKVTVEILDASGKTIQTLAGDPQADKKAAAAAKHAAEEGRRLRSPVKPPTRNAGLNMVSWNLQYPSADSFPGLVYWGANPDEGPSAVPGDYQVRITAAGVTQTQPFKLEKDPRLTQVTMADLQQQFDLAMKIRNELSEANDMVISIRKVKKELDDRLKQSTDSGLASAAGAFRAKLTTIEENVYQVRNHASEDPLNFPIKLNNQIATLGRDVMLGEGAPTSQSYVIFKLLTERLDQQKNDLTTTMQSGMASVNPILAQQKLEPLR